VIDLDALSWHFNVKVTKKEMGMKQPIKVDIIMMVEIEALGALFRCVF
jgi:hypothetical protein